MNISLGFEANGWNSHVRTGRGFPGKFESTNLGRDDLSRVAGLAAEVFRKARRAIVRPCSG